MKPFAVFPLIVGFLLVGGCTNEAEKTIESPESFTGTPMPINDRPTSVHKASDENSTPVKRVKMVLPPTVKGIELNYQKVKKEGEFYSFTDLSIVEANASFVVDAFPEKNWGWVKAKLGDKSVQLIFENQSGFLRVTYLTPGHETLQTKNECQWGSKPTDKDYQAVLPDVGERGAPWDSVVAKLSGLAEQGHLKAYQFFMEPSAEQKKYGKYNDGAASFSGPQERLKYMKAHGCVWK